MVGRGGIWDGSLDTWSSIGVAATVRKCSLRQTAHHCSGSLLTVHDPDKGQNVPQNETARAAARCGTSCPQRDNAPMACLFGADCAVRPGAGCSSMQYAKLHSQKLRPPSRAMTRRCVFGPAAAGARERSATTLAYLRGLFFPQGKQRLRNRHR